MRSSGFRGLRLVPSQGVAFDAASVFSIAWAPFLSLRDCLATGLRRHFRANIRGLEHPP